MSAEGDLVLCADTSACPIFEPFLATVVFVNGDSVDVKRKDNGDIEPMAIEYVWYIVPFLDVNEAES
jgi:hypothetical protein